jgi:translation initiation factor 5A
VSAKVYAPIVERRNAQVISIAGNVVQMMDLESYENFEVTVDDEVLGRIETGKEIVYIYSMEKRKIDFL